MPQTIKAQKKKPAPPIAAVPAEPKASTPDIGYTISMSKPWTHLLEVEMQVSWSDMPDRIELKMPVWTPGSYLIREYARNVQGFAVKDGSGAALMWRKTSKNTWQVDSKGSKQIVAAYRIYSNELTVRTNELNDEHGFWNNAATLFFLKDQLRAPSTVTIKPFGNWRVATGLPPVDGQANTFRAPNFDILYDSPFEVSDYKEVAFDVEGKRHRIVFSGPGNYDMQRLAADVPKIVEEAYKIFGEFGYDNYTFIVNLRGGGGLEHLNSTALQTNRFGFRPDARYKGFLGLVAHEYFHNYNVKRIRPDALGPFDYENENYTRMLWVAEGGTEYYATLLLLRAGFITPEEFLKSKAQNITRLQSTPGRLETSAEDASFDAWIKYYRQDENSVNNQISYYDKGELLMMLLDMRIRTESGGTKSLDDVMRYLWSDFFKKGKNYGPADFQHAAELVAGTSLDDFFSKYVRSTAEIDYNSLVNGLGLVTTVKQPNALKAFLGGDTVEANGVITIRSLPAGTPAYEQGLNTGDQIIALDGYRAVQEGGRRAGDKTFFQAYLADRKPGDKVRVTVFRADRMREFDVTLGGDNRGEYEFSKNPSPTDTQRRLYKQYFDAEL